MKNIENDSPKTIARRKYFKADSKKRRRSLTNADFMKQDNTFIEACNNAGIPVTHRQASKWRNKQGIAYINRNKG